MLQIKKFTFNPFAENTYVLFDHTNACIVIDPGCYEKTEQQELTAFIDSNNLVVKKLVNTHCHIDHVLGNAFIKRKYNVDLFIHPHEEPFLRAVKSYASNYGFFQYEDSMADKFLTEKDSLEFGEQKLQILFVPGHSPGHIAFYDAAGKSLIGGDVLFENSIGRTDLPGGNFNTLINSIHEKFFTLPDDVTVYCGHGDETRIGFEKRTNPFCAITQ
ncbi:MAG: MBL fold metallo-hydrolase [Cyclobacteriaceae bacterium]|nr:MAG: MBL fold metallo-hydrolase [Cyclobacteriaceae bacterium]